MSDKSISTKKKIENAAKKCFLEKGFAGASISYIAKTAGVPKGLPYHYFRDKQELWIEVKMSILKRFSTSDIFESAPSNNLNEYLEYVVGKRFELYASNPDIVRMIHWQTLEPENTALESISGSKVDITKAWKDALLTLQKKGELRSDLNTKHVFTHIMTAASGPFMQSPTPFGKSRSKQQEKDYLEMLIDILYKGLKA